MMLTPEDQSKLLSYTLLPTLTPDQAHHVKRCMPANCWLDPHKIRWWYPVDDKGFPIHPGTVRYDQPVRAVKVLPPRTYRQPSPASVENQRPWVLEGMSRTTWYGRKAAAPLLVPIISQLPLWLGEAEGLKLYTHLAGLARIHKRDINGLWLRVCEALKAEG